mmetsp:Transcript_13224/g.33306  ORF Transcript_13224/g.33306 Transcript_13224/m.33306 type:complete len:554 (-) Transcript_13224:49-1710(-)
MVVNGETAVLLDESSDSNFVRDKVYLAIYHGLADVSFLNGFTNSVVSAELLSEGHASLVETSDLYTMLEDTKASYPSGVTTTVAVAAASVTIVVASMFCYGFMRRPNSRDPSVRHRNRSLPKVNPKLIVGGRPMRRHFVRLEDLSASPTFPGSISPRTYPYHIPEEEFQDYDDEEEYYTEVNYNPAINWSVSDITSDSASLRSGVSRTPSMLERIDEEIEDEDEDFQDDEDDKSCNFSYSEDSTIISNALVKAGIVSPDDLEEDDDHDHDPADTHSDKLLDLSDLDPCFTILPENTDELFGDLEDLSEGTQDSPLESIILELKLSRESDCDSFQTAMSDTTMISLPDFAESVPEDSHEMSFDRSETSTMKSLVSVAMDALLANATSSPLREQDSSDSFCTAIDESPIRAVNPKEELNASNITLIQIITQGEEDEDSTPNDIIHTVSDSDGELSHSQVESKMDDNASQEYDASIASSKSCEDKIPSSIKSLDFYNPDQVKEVDIGKNENGDDGTLHSLEEDDGTNHLCEVDSIDEWVHELMNQEPKSECSVDKT